MGRPTKLTPDRQQVIIDSLAMGNFVETACAVAGIHKDTFYEWMKAAEADPASAHGQFRAAVQMAQAKAEAAAVAGITAAGSAQWQALAWRLERMYPDKWGQRMRVDSRNEHTGKNGGPIVVQTAPQDEEI